MGMIEYKCPCCAGKIEFNISSQNMKCPYCDTEFEVETIRQYNEELGKYEDSNDQQNWNNKIGSEWQQGEQEAINEYYCESCGGKIITDENTAATSCPYCGNNVVLTGRLSGSLRPDYVIPFKMDKNQAVEALKKHTKGKLLLPKVFKEQNHIEEIKGMYVPFWLFDADTNGRIQYKATKTRSWSDRNYIYTENSYYSVVRAGGLSFKLVPVDGSYKMPDDLMESIEPFDFSEAVDFQTAYLSGYLADKYDVDSNICMNRANERIKVGMEDAFRNTVTGYSSVVCETNNVNVLNGDVKYVLYPVWILTTRWKDQNYIFAMNGQTGKFVGNMPLDKGAYARWFIGITLIIGILVNVLCSLI